MKLNVQKRISASIMKCSGKRVRFNTFKLDAIKESITKDDLRKLIKDNIISKKQKQGVSRARAKKLQIQKSKGRRKGVGSRKGSKNARTNQKESWINKVRLQRELLKRLRDNKAMTTITYRSLYRKSKGGFFRSKRHLQGYIGEHKLLSEKDGNK